MDHQGENPTVAPEHVADDSGHFKAYMIVFAVLCVLTAVSFIVNELERSGMFSKQAGLVIILSVAIVKALCVAAIFMHLKQDWGNLYFIIIPVCIMGVMMMIVFLPDIVLTWHHE